MQCFGKATAFGIKAKGVVDVHLFGGGALKLWLAAATPLHCPWKVFFSLSRSAVSLDNKGLAGQIGKELRFPGIVRCPVPLLAVTSLFPVSYPR